MQATLISRRRLWCCKGRHVNEDVSCTCAVSSKQVYKQLLRDGYLEMLIDAGVRILETACGPCCAIGQSPATKGVAVRTSNRNFKGRAGNPTAEIYLVSPESAAATAIHWNLRNRRGYPGRGRGRCWLKSKSRMSYPVDDSMIIKPLPEEEAKKVEIVTWTEHQVPSDSGSADASICAFRSA